MPSERPLVLVTGVRRSFSNIGRQVADRLLAAGLTVRVLVHRDGAAADDLRARGAEVVVGDLTKPTDVASAIEGVRRIFFTMAISPQYLEAATVVAALAQERTDLEIFVNMSQMTVSQMTSTSVEESDHQRLHWLVERVLRWSGLPVSTVRSTVFLDNPMFSVVPRAALASHDVLTLPIGTGRTSPVASTDVSHVVARLLEDPIGQVGATYELTGPEVLGLEDLAERFGEALGRPVRGRDLPDDLYEQTLSRVPGISPHVVQHVLTVARLHRAGRYDRLTSDVQNVTGAPATSVASYVGSHLELFLGAPAV